MNVSDIALFFLYGRDLRFQDVSHDPLLVEITVYEPSILRLGTSPDWHASVRLSHKAEYRNLL